MQISNTEVREEREGDTKRDKTDSKDIKETETIFTPTCEASEVPLSLSPVSPGDDRFVFFLSSTFLPGTTTTKQNPHFRAASITLTKQLTTQVLFREKEKNHLSRTSVKVRAKDKREVMQAFHPQKKGKGAKGKSVSQNRLCCGGGGGGGSSNSIRGKLLSVPGE